MRDIFHFYSHSFFEKEKILSKTGIVYIIVPFLAIPYEKFMLLIGIRLFMIIMNQLTSLI